MPVLKYFEMRNCHSHKKAIILKRTWHCKSLLASDTYCKCTGCGTENADLSAGTVNYSIQLASCAVKILSLRCKRCSEICSRWSYIFSNAVMMQKLILLMSTLCRTILGKRYIEIGISLVDPTPEIHSSNPGHSLVFCIKG